MTSNELICINGVSFAYADGTEAVSNLSLSVGAGEIVGVVGPSGCGKSTLLGLLTGRLTPTSGNITWPQGRLSMGRGAGARSAIGMVFQKDALFEWLTVERNILFGLQQMRVPKDECQSRLDQILDLGRLTEARHKHPNQLSGGMKRRAAFARTMVTRPGFLLLDEPFSALDEPTRVQLHQDIFELIRQLGATVLLVTHDLAEAISLCDRLAILSRRPAHVVRQREIPFGRERDLFDLRSTAEYLELYGSCWRDLDAQIRGTEVGAQSR